MNNIALCYIILYYYIQTGKYKIYFLYRVIPINIDFVFECTMSGFRFRYGYC